MILLLDTNVLVRLQDTVDARHSEAVAATKWLIANGNECQIVPQVLDEFWVVATRPLESNGLGLNPETCNEAIRGWMTIFKLRLDERGVFQRWETLVTTKQVRGKVAHDARLVAAMQRHGLRNLLTFNPSDFARFASIGVYTPADVIDGKLA